MTPKRTSHSITQKLVESNFVWANPEQTSTMTRHWKRGQLKLAPQAPHREGEKCAPKLPHVSS